MRRYFQKKFCCVESNVVLGFKGLKWELSHISLKESLNQSLVENHIPVRPKLEVKEPQSALFAAQNCPASQRALKKPPWGEFHCSHGSFCFVTGIGLSGQTLLNQEQAGTGTAMALTPTVFSYTFSVSKGRWKSSVATKSSAKEGTEGLEKRRKHKLNSWRELLWYCRKCYQQISVLHFRIMDSSVF